MHLNGVTFDSYAFLAFEVHVVEHLILQLSCAERLGLFEQTVGKRAFAVVDMGDYAKITYVFHADNFNSAQS